VRAIAIFWEGRNWWAGSSTWTRCGF